ncbi:hypothetical protein DFP72DRAFT_803115 [Ephemerocybe angulata]|uniref:Cytochrome P450 n=1 Tax=Ephemerocybe angulata TaxID=980116 RepID=A0A8H6ICH1_9AGAR|nr:hypothetical protein DFP72DRAFT_803115 [Tulosesus angulatus]
MDSGKPTQRDSTEKSYVDKVLAHNRLPNGADRARLPYQYPTSRPFTRWNPVAPLGTTFFDNGVNRANSLPIGLPHMLSEDDEYNGYFLPAGTIVVGNTWQAPHLLHLRRTTTLHTPTSALSSAFGYGRRACPGRFLADQQLFITFATLSLFEIGPGLDEIGGPVPVEARFTSGMIWYVRRWAPIRTVL